MKAPIALLGCVLLAAPACAHLKMPKEPAGTLVKRSAGSPKGTIYYCGYSHIDFNWLWDWPDTAKTWDSTARTALNLMYRFPDFHFGQTQAAAYIAMERIKPDVFADIKLKVAAGNWDLIGGMWDESDENIPSGEALARTFLLGQTYFQEKFNKQSLVGYLPDTFGHTRQLPQILQQAELQNFYFQRCNVTSPKTVHLFWWRAPDNSRVLAYSSPGWYNDHADQAAQTDFPSTILAESGVNLAMVSYGVGDHGGGPTITDLTTLEMLKTDPTFPEVKETAAIDFFNACRAQEPTAGFPLVDRDLQYTFEGCYTTHADMKRIVRDGENALYTAEVFSSLASIYGLDYPYDDLRSCWRHNSFNQFHDIAPGTAIHSTYEDAANKAKFLKQTTEKHIGNAWSVLEPHVDTTGTGAPLVIFNPLAWSRTDPVETTVDFPAQPAFVSVTDQLGNRIPSQITGVEQRDGHYSVTFVFVAENVPSMGYRVYHAAAADADLTVADPLTLVNNVVQTQTLRVTLDPASGQVSSLYDKVAAREVIASGQRAFRLVALGENTNNSAWSISLNGASTTMDTPTSYSVIETGPVRARVRAVYKNGASTYTQDLAFYRNIPRVDANVTADFQDYNVLIKSIIPTSLTTPTATFDAPYYAITRATDGHVDVPMQKWMDESATNGSYGVSVLNDCKYGADANGSTMRISLLRGTHDPDTIGDQGVHHMSYSVYPHSGTWKTADTMRRGYQYNIPLRVMPCTVHTGDWGPGKSLLSSNLPNIAICALKRAEDGNGFILRYYDYAGSALNGSITFPKNIASIAPTNILEHTQPGTISTSQNVATVTTRPYGISSMRVTF
ncbi:MAG TPA: glycoside hydrolase family 38 C-terminal domain-containing protein [Armatimonadota bacterium]|jgi:alpha-mannosidase